MDRGGVVLAGVAAVATGLVAALGGFAPAAGAPPYRPGEPVGLLRWDLTVNRAELVAGDADHEPEVRVWFTVVNTTDETMSQPWGLVSLVLSHHMIPAMKASVAASRLAASWVERCWPRRFPA